MLLWLLRILLYIQFLLGFDRFLTNFSGLAGVGIQLNERVWETHISLGLLIAILAIFALRPVRRVPNSGVRQVARFLPLLPLFLGIGFLAGAIGGTGLVIVHALLGITCLGLVEAAAGRQHRALRRSVSL